MLKASEFTINLSNLLAFKAKSGNYYLKHILTRVSTGLGGEGKQGEIPPPLCLSKESSQISKSNHSMTSIKNNEKIRKN